MSLFARDTTASSLKIQRLDPREPATPEFTVDEIISVDWNWLVPQSVLEQNVNVRCRGGIACCLRRVDVARAQQIIQDEGRSMIDVTGVKVFSATKAKERELLGELITDWIRNHPEHEIVDKIVTQSSDSEFHCLTITLFYKHNAKQ
jgi:hypothetical protein